MLENIAEKNILRERFLPIGSYAKYCLFDHVKFHIGKYASKSCSQEIYVCRHFSYHRTCVCINSTDN